MSGTKARQLTLKAAEAAEVRAATTHPDVVALKVEQSRPVVEIFIWLGIIIGLLFTMTNVQQFAADTTNATHGTLEWWACWLLDPTVSCVLLGILFAERHTARWQVPGMEQVRNAKWALLVATYVMNTWHSYATANLAGIVLHSVPPLVAFVGAVMVTRLQDRLTECVHRAHDDASKRTGRRAAAPIPQPEPVRPAPVAPSISSPLARPTIGAPPVPSAPPDGRPSLRDLVQAADQTGPAQPAPSAPEPAPVAPKPAPAPVRPAPVSAASKPADRTRTVRKPADAAAVRKAIAKIAGTGATPNVTNVRAWLRTNGYSAANGRIGPLLAEVQSDTTDRPRLHVAGGA